MARDDHPRIRQLAKVRRTQGRREAYQRILIVCEGTKTEPQYFNEIKRAKRLSNANIRIIPGGVDPLSLVDIAVLIFINGDQKAVSRSFDEVYVVFDRDDHNSYHNALGKVNSLNRKYKNDENQFAKFIAIASVPCFELWLLVHYEPVLAPIQRVGLYGRLKIHLPNYEKGDSGIFSTTKVNLDTAIQRAEDMSRLRNAHDDNGPYTGVHELVNKLLTVRET